MPKIVKQRQPYLSDKKELFEHAETGRVYTRIIGAIVWPMEKPGFAVVLAEECITPTVAPRYWWIAEAEDSTHNDLIHRCVELQADYSVQDWFAREDPAADELLEYHNRQAFERRVPALHVREPYQVDKRGLIAVQLNILRDHLDPRRKSLKLSDESKIAGMMQEIPKIVSDARDIQFPGPAALAYALNEFVIHPYQFTLPRASDDYDPMNHLRGKRRPRRDGR